MQTLVPAALKPTLESLYLAATHEEHWDTALAELSTAFDSPRVALLRATPGLRAVVQIRARNHDPEAQRLYHDYYWALDPSNLIAPEARVGQWLDRPELFDPATTPRPEYMDFAVRWGIRYVCGGKVHSDETTETFLGLQRPMGHSPFDEQSARVFELLAPHIRLAASIAAELNAARLSQGLAQAALDGLPGLVYAVNAEGRVMIANACGERHLASKAPFCTHAGVLTSVDPNVAARLSSALKDARALVGTGFRCNAGADTWLIRVLPIAVLPGTAVVYATSTVPSPVPAELLKQVLGFSTSEAEVAYLMADGLSAKEIAHARRVSITTIRTQIREVFRKAGVRRQADLSRLLWSVPRLHEASTQVRNASGKSVRS